jgi:protein-S-isoprenylcysteine O-methyltransferase Ste14
MIFRRFLFDMLQWLLANAVVLLAAGKVTSFMRDPKGAVFLLVLNVLWLVPVAGNLYVPRSRIKTCAKQHCYYLWMGVLLVELGVAAFEYGRFGIQSGVARSYAVTGLAVICLGFFVSLIGWLSIRRYSAPQFQIIEGHRVVDGGLYRYVRHPIYLGFFLIAVGLPIFLRSLAGLIVLIVLVMPAWIYIIREEEKFLVLALGDDYRAYIGRTKRLIPFVY